MRIKNRWFILQLFLIMFFSFSFSQAQSGQPDFTTVITQSMLQKQEKPGDFATVLYGLVLAHEQVDANYEEKLASLFFTQDLFKKYIQVYMIDQQSKEVGCLDSRIFTNAQDVYQAFWLGKMEKSGKNVLIPIYLEMNNEPFILGKPHINLQLVKTAQGWKVDDIIYPEEKFSLRKQLQACLKH